MTNAKPKPPSEQKPELPVEHAEIDFGIADEPKKMTVKTISATYERKFNLGEYESANFGVTSWADVEPDANPALCLDELQELCKNQVRKQAQNVLRMRKNGGAEYAELQDNYFILEGILNDALEELKTQEPHEDAYQALVARWNALKGVS